MARGAGRASRKSQGWGLATDTVPALGYWGALVTGAIVVSSFVEMITHTP